MTNAIYLFIPTALSSLSLSLSLSLTHSPSVKLQKDGMVLEDMFIPGPSQQYLKKGFKVMKDTVEGEEPLYHKQLAYKRAPKSEIKKVIVDIIVCRCKDNISKLYTKSA